MHMYAYMHTTNTPAHTLYACVLKTLWLSPPPGKRGRLELKYLGTVSDHDDEEGEEEGRGRRGRMRAARNVNSAAYAVDLTEDGDEMESPASSSTRESSGGRRGRGGRGGRGGKSASNTRIAPKKKSTNQNTESDSPNLSESAGVSWCWRGWCAKG